MYASLYVNTKTMNRQEIMTRIPHRPPMLLVDESEWDGDCVVSRYTVKEDEFFTQGHFPGYPVVPGVILCEMMAQASFLLIPGEDMKGHTGMYAGLDGVKFKNSVFPGDTVCVRSRLIGRKGPAVFIEAKASVEGKICCMGKLSFILVENDNLKK